MLILDHFTSFQAILAVLDNFGRVLLFKKTGNFEILAKSLFESPVKTPVPLTPPYEMTLCTQESMESCHFESQSAPLRAPGPPNAAPHFEMSVYTRPGKNTCMGTRPAIWWTGYDVT